MEQQEIVPVLRVKIIEHQESDSAISPTIPRTTISDGGISSAFERARLKEHVVNKAASLYTISSSVDGQQEPELMAANDLLSQLQYAFNRDDSHLAGNNQEWLQPADILLIDTRDTSAFNEISIFGSINLEIPALVQKRLKKKMFSNFNILNFLSNQAQKEIVEKWLNSSSPNKTLVIFNGESHVQESEARLLASAFANGLAADVAKNYSNDSFRVAMLEGGLASFTIIPQARPFYTSTQEITAAATPIKQTRSLSLSISALPVKKGLSLNSASAHKKGPSLMLPRRASDECMLSPSLMMEDDIESATDNAAPNAPFSYISPHIIIGSDVVPTGPEAVEELKQLHVTHILNMASEIYNSSAVQESSLFSLKWIPVIDNTEQDMDPPLQEAIQFIGKRC